MRRSQLVIISFFVEAMLQIHHIGRRSFRAWALWLNGLFGWGGVGRQGGVPP